MMTVMETPTMNRHVFILLAAALLCARTASAQAVLQRCDKPLADAELMAQTVTDCASARVAFAPLVPPPGASATVEKVEYSTSPMPAAVDLAVRAQPLAGHLVDYYVYTAFAAGDPALCAPLEQVATARKCRQDVGKLFFRQALMAPAPQFVKACVRSETEVADAQTTKCCELTAEVRGRPAACAQLMAKCQTDEPSCRAFAASTTGDASACKGLPLVTDGCDPKIPGECARYQAGEIAKCEGTAAFARAFKAKDISLCGGLRECRALMGGAKEVAQEIAAKHLRNPAGEWFLTSGWKKPVRTGVRRVAVAAPAAAAAAPKVPAPFKGFTCGEVLATVDNRRAVADAVSAAHMCLKDVETALQKPTRDVIAAIDARSEKLTRMSLRFERLFGEAPGAKPKAPAAR